MNFWPVIHFHNALLAFKNADLAVRAGAKGIFLIHMEGRDDRLDGMGEALMKTYPHLQIGVNYLSLNGHDALRRAVSLGYHASWSDRPGIRSDQVESQVPTMTAFLTEFPEHTFFASVAFKYQPEDPDPARAAKLALQFGMVPTTSGRATGSAPPVVKLQQIRQAIGLKATGTRLALASGVDENTLESLAPYLTDVLVATGISEDEHRFSKEKILRLSEIIRTLANTP